MNAPRDTTGGHMLRALELGFWQADRDVDAAPEDSPARADAAARFEEFDDRMAKAVPVDLEGVAAKLRYLKWDCDISGNQTAEEAARTALEGLERIMGEVTS